MGCAVQRQRVQTRRNLTVWKRRLRLGSATRSHFPAPPRRLEPPTEVCKGVARTKEQSQRRVRNLLLRMVLKDRRVLKGQTRAQLILARRTTLHPKAVYICADLSSRPKLFPCSRAADHTFVTVSRAPARSEPTGSGPNGGLPKRPSVQKRRVKWFRGLICDETSSPYCRCYLVVGLHRILHRMPASGVYWRLTRR
jgi:hypothetical protein